MYREACLTRALNSFICTADGQFPDPDDCTKYHVCNDSSHTIVECPATHRFWFNDPVITENPNERIEEFYCRFAYIDSCGCESFGCEGQANTFVFRPSDRLYYAYCLEIGSTKKTMMFKCPSGTVHNNMMSVTNSEDCVPWTPAL